MLDSVTAVLEFTKGKRRQSLEHSQLLVSAVIREFEILGEAAGQISKKTQSKYSDLPWKQLIGMRNRLIHAYFDIDDNIIWATIKEHLPSLKDSLGQIVNDWDQIST